MRTVLVLLHAAPGVIGLVAGLPALVPPRTGDRRTWWRRVYAGCIATLLAVVVVLVAYDWADLEQGARLAFVGLIGLGAVMAYRLWRAHQLAAAGTPEWQDRYLGHVYFTYISLWVGFLVIPALATPLPQVAVPVVVVVVLVVGHLILARHRRRLVAPVEPSS